MSIIRSITQWVHERVWGGVAVLATTCTLLIASATSALAAPGDWVTPNCNASGLDTFKSGLQSLTQSAAGWAFIGIIAIAGLCVVTIPFTALFRGKALSASLKFLAYAGGVVFFAGAILTFLFSKAQCV